MNLFIKNKDNNRPLAEEVRPKILNEIFGQEHLFEANSLVNLILRTGKIQNLILWGPSGSGKTTLANIIINKVKESLAIEKISAVASSTAELKKIFSESLERKKHGKSTVLLVDEIHHLNKTQQDLFLPFIEDGSIYLIALTTENPSFEINNALLSRSIVITLKKLDEAALEKILVRAEEFYKRKLPLNNDDREKLRLMADGDGRYLLNICEYIFHMSKDFPQDQQISLEAATNFIVKTLKHDKANDQHYNLISAFHKSVRGSDCDASLYWLERMLMGGENPYYILRRMVRIASEDIGLADPNSITQVIAAKDAYDFLGSPEGELAIVQAAIYLATAPKSNAIYLAEKQAKQDVEKFGSIAPPIRIINAPTKFMKEQGYGNDYIYDHDTHDCFSGQNYFPKEIGRRNYYLPNSRGFEKEIQKRLEYWNNLRSKKNKL